MLILSNLFPFNHFAFVTFNATECFLDPGCCEKLQRSIRLDSERPMVEDRILTHIRMQYMSNG